MEMWFVLAGGVSLLTACTHTFVGEKAIVRPLLEIDGLHDVSRFTNYYCWHIVTIVLFSISAMFFYVSIKPTAVEVAWIATFFSAAFTFWSIGMIVWKKLSFKQFPQWALISPMAIFGVLGLLA